MSVPTDIACHHCGEPHHLDLSYLLDSLSPAQAGELIGEWIAQHRYLDRETILLEIKRHLHD